MAAQEIIANLAAQVRRLMAEHAKLRGLCDRMKTEGDALRKRSGRACGWPKGLPAAVGIGNGRGRVSTV